MTRAEGALPWLLFWAVFILYAATAYPTIAPRDSGDLAAAAVALGVAHPPGYPLYSILGKLWTGLLPLGDEAYRLNLLSSAAGAAAAAVLFSALRGPLGLVPALGGALAWALSAPLRKFSGLQEMYSLHALFAVASIALTRGLRESVLRRLQLGSLLLGLGLVNHQTLILLVPGLALLWRSEFRRHGLSAPPLRGTAFFFLLGLIFYAVVWILLKDSHLAWAVVRRAEYGSLTLSGRFAVPLSASAAWNLLAFFFSGLVASLSWPAAALAVLGAYELRREGGLRAGGYLLGFILTGPFYFLLTRFDVSTWLARSVLESGFLIPGLLASVAVGQGLLRMSSQPGAAAAALLVVVAAGLWNVEGHRQDFAAHDYISDLRRRVPPGGAIVLAGDTALFGWRYRAAVEALKTGAQRPSREWLSALEDDKKKWIEKQSALGPVLLAGLDEVTLSDLGLVGGPRRLEPQGPVQRVLVGSPRVMSGDLNSAGWELSALRPGEHQDSYGRDVSHSYAYARYLTGRLLETGGASEPVTAEHYRLASALDPETFRLVREPVLLGR